MTTRALNLGIDDVHVDGVPKKTTMADISTKQRKALPASQFADPENRAYPIHDAAHVRNAAARLEQQKGSMAPAKYRAIRRRIAGAARKIGVDSEYNKPTRRKRMSLTIDHPQHGRIEIRHMADKPNASVPWCGIELDAATALSDDAEPTKAVWIQLAIQGRFFKDGTFFDLDDKAFADVVRNFEASSNKRVPVDFEHATEAAGSSGSIPTSGAPAQGWIVALDNRGQGGLWGLVEWNPLAREYIRNKNYRFISPAVRFGCKDPRTARDIGARLTSAGLTNTPFLDGMRPLAAKDNESMTTPTEEKPVTVTLKDGATMCYSAHEYMPAIRGALKLPELATAEMCKQHLGMLRDHFEAAGKDHTATVSGIRLGDYMMPMRDALKPPIDSSWDDLLDLVEDLIDAAMDQHVTEYHEGAQGAPVEEAKMSDKLELQLKDAETSNAKLSLQLKDAESKVTELAAAIASRDTEIKTLKDAESKRAESADNETVEMRFAAYKQAKNLTDDDKKAMLITMRADRPLFDKLYPPIDPAKAYLLRDISTGPGAKPPTAGPPASSVVIPDQKVLIAKFQKEGKTLEEAVSLAFTEAQSALIKQSA